MRPKIILDVRRLLKPDFLVPAALFLFAFILRAYGVRGWLPYVVHPDEPKLIDSAVHIVKTGDLNPNLYIWPSLYIYLEALVIKAHVWWGTLRGYYTGPQSLPDVSHVFSLAPGVYSWARLFSAFVGAITVPLLYVVGRQMFNGSRRVGVAAALLIAVSPLHVEYSHFALTDVPLALAGLAVLWASHRLSRARIGGKHIFWQATLCGLLVGVATGTKYNGLYLLTVPLIALIMVWLDERRRAKDEGQDAAKSSLQALLPTAYRLLPAASGVLLGAVGGFLLCEPYAVLDWNTFYYGDHGFLFQVRAYEPADTIEQAWASVVRHLEDLSRSDSHLFLPAIVGAVALIANPPLRKRAPLLLLFPPLYLLAMSRFSLTYVRNLLVTLPFLALVGAYAIDLVATQVTSMARSSGLLRPQDRHLWGAARWGVLGVALAIVIANPLKISTEYSKYMGNPDNRTLVWEWMRERMGAGERFAAELHPWHTEDYPDVLPFDVENPEAQQPLTARPPEWYAHYGYDYVVLNSNMKDWQRDPAMSAKYERLFLVKRYPGDAEGGKGPAITVLSTHEAALTGMGLPSIPLLPPMARLSGARVNDFAQLLGYDFAPLTSTDLLLEAGAPLRTEGFKRGEAIGLNLYFRALRDGRPDDPGWQVWVHLVDPSTGGTVAQIDVPPLTGQLRNYPAVQREARPVSLWHGGEFLGGVYNFSLPTDLPSGTYRLETGMWVPPNGPGVKISYDPQMLLGGKIWAPPANPLEDRVILGEITVR